MAKIQLRQKKRFSALGTKPVKKVASSEETSAKPTTDNKEDVQPTEVVEEMKVEEKTGGAETEAGVDTKPVNTAASYKQTMVPNSVRKRLRAEKRAAKGQTSETTAKSDTGSVAETAAEKETVETVESGPKRFGNLFNLGATSEEESKEEVAKVDIIKPQAIEEVVRQPGGSQSVDQTASTHTDQLDPSLRSKNRSKDREFESLANNDIQEFSVDAFTQESERLKAEGKLDEYKRPLTAIGGGKHQITSLLRQAQDNKEQLEASYSQNRLTQKESGAKYGF